MITINDDKITYKRFDASFGALKNEETFQIEVKKKCHVFTEYTQETVISESSINSTTTFYTKKILSSEEKYMSYQGRLWLVKEQKQRHVKKLGKVVEFKASQVAIDPYNR
jgi:hypothetical protein